MSDLEARNRELELKCAGLSVLLRQANEDLRSQREELRYLRACVSSYFFVVTDKQEHSVQLFSTLEDARKALYDIDYKMRLQWTYLPWGAAIPTPDMRDWNREHYIPKSPYGTVNRVTLQKPEPESELPDRGDSKRARPDSKKVPAS